MRFKDWPEVHAYIETLPPLKSLLTGEVEIDEDCLEALIKEIGYKSKAAYFQSNSKLQLGRRYYAVETVTPKVTWSFNDGLKVSFG